QVLPRAGDALDLRLAAELAVGADLARDARHLVGERSQLVDHRVDGVLELEDLAADVDGDLLREVGSASGRGHVGDVPHLGRQVAGHHVDAVGQVLPRPGDAFHVGLPAEPPVGAHFARHACDLRGEGAQLVDHRVDDVLDLENLAADVDGDLLR